MENISLTLSKDLVNLDNILNYLGYYIRVLIIIRKLKRDILEMIK
jgi:uncharacterized protein YciW